MTDEYTLLRAGPVNVPDSIREELLYPHVGHRSREFQELFDSLTDNLAYVFQASDEYEFAVLTGSGTAALESVACSLAPTNVLVINNGAFGDRLARLCRIHGHDVIEQNGEPGKVDLDSLDETLSKSSEVEYVGVVHSETSTGRLNPIEEINEIAKDHDCKVIVDAISSLGTAKVNVGEMEIDICVSNSNKGIEAPPVISYVCIRGSLRQELRDEPRCFYLDLGRHLEYAAKNQTPTTPAIPLFYSVNQALEEIREEGLEARIQRYEDRMEYLGSRLENLPVQIRVKDPAERSNTSILFSFDDSFEFSKLNEYMRENGFQIYPSKYESNEVHIAWLGSVEKSRVDEFFELLKNFFTKQRT